jgi:transposase
MTPIPRESYSASEKLIIIDYALSTSQTRAAFQFGIHKSMVCRWIKNYTKIKHAKPSNKRIGNDFF